MRTTRHEIESLARTVAGLVDAPAYGPDAQADGAVFVERHSPGDGFTRYRLCRRVGGGIDDSVLGSWASNRARDFADRLRTAIEMARLILPPDDFARRALRFARKDGAK